MRSHLTHGVVGILVLAGACGPATRGPDAGSQQAAPRDQVVCGPARFDEDRLTDGASAAALPNGPAGAVDDLGDPAIDDARQWRVVHATDDRVQVLRELDEPIDQGGGDLRTHEARVLERISGATNVPDGTWLLTSSTPCTPRIATSPEFGPADLSLAHEPDADDTVIEVLARERACASGRTAEDRIEVVEVRETDEVIAVQVAVRLPNGDQTCQENPPTPIAVELDGAVGARQVVDASLLPPRALPLADREEDAPR